MKGAKQTTLRHPVAVSGIGVHSGLPVTLTLHPADDDAGIVFQRIATDGSIEREIRADVRAVTATEFATVLGDAEGPLCSTAERAFGIAKHRGEFGGRNGAHVGADFTLDGAVGSDALENDAGVVVGRMKRKGNREAGMN